MNEISDGDFDESISHRRDDSLTQNNNYPIQELESTFTDDFSENESLFNSSLKFNESTENKRRYSIEIQALKEIPEEAPEKVDIRLSIPENFKFALREYIFQKLLANQREDIKTSKILKKQNITNMSEEKTKVNRLEPVERFENCQERKRIPNLKLMDRLESIFQEEYISYLQLIHKISITADYPPLSIESSDESLRRGVQSIIAREVYSILGNNQTQNQIREEIFRKYE